MRRPPAREHVAQSVHARAAREWLQRADDWNDDKLRRERELYEGAVSRKALARALGTGLDGAGTAYGAGNQGHISSHVSGRLHDLSHLLK